MLDELVLGLHFCKKVRYCKSRSLKHESGNPLLFSPLQGIKYVQGFQIS